MKRLRLLKGGELSIDNLRKAIDKSKNIDLDRFIFSIGIRHIGQENAKILSGFFKNISNFSNLFNETEREEILKNLAELDGIGETQIGLDKQFFFQRK